jgi:hypothetical protein
MGTCGMMKTSRAGRVVVLGWGVVGPPAWRGRKSEPRWARISRGLDANGSDLYIIGDEHLGRMPRHTLSIISQSATYITAQKIHSTLHYYLTNCTG